MHQWLALNNPDSENFAQIQAYLKVAVTVACRGDEQVQINDQEESDDDAVVMMSPSLNPKFYQIKIRIFEGQDLPAMDSAMGFIGKVKIDAYMKCEFKGKKLRTPTIVHEKGGAPARWNYEFWLPA